MESLSSSFFVLGRNRLAVQSFGEDDRLIDQTGTLCAECIVSFRILQFGDGADVAGKEFSGSGLIAAFNGEQRTDFFRFAGVAVDNLRIGSERSGKNLDVGKYGLRTGP